jgi:hypothetical protein
MSVTKSKSLTWDGYLRGLAASPFKPTENEMAEFAGFLLERDLEDDNKYKKLTKALFKDDEELVIDMSKYLMATSPESTEQLLKTIKQRIVNFYEDEINFLLKETIIELDKDKKLNFTKDTESYDDDSFHVSNLCTSENIAIL